MGAKRIRVAHQRVRGAGLAVGQCVIAASGGAVQASTNGVARGVSSRVRAALASRTRGRGRFSLAAGASARSRATLGARVGRALAIRALVSISIGLAGG